ncbi:long-chain fatty acid transport protein [Vulcaniibacterium tengchongense]|uniref:Long-chain fatty acid transport protein n=1 Tax=Vulcaniibacterium tengchongense TaxID=1273429 RepID=A0A3N4VSC6_9GAMM|nr:outer membrane protein transport protein [Vulcaniibacterium tengchongense]RPE75964.1 long-chain fatty acid transport protein [Vulcaniibacterium tengchongense]
MQRVSRFTRLSALTLGIAGALSLGQAHASGFQIKENSVKAQGRSYAGSAAVAGDASVVSNNPALMTRFEGTTVQADVTAIDLGFKFEGSGTDALGQPLSGGTGGDAGDLIPVPALSVVHKLDNGLALGAMVSAPFGLKTEYEGPWAGRYWADTSDLKTVDLTLSMAYEVVPDRFSFGLGVIYERADVTLSRYVDFGTLLFANPATRPLPFARPQAADGHAEVEGDSTGWGWLVGFNLRPTDKLSIGFSHRSEIDHEIEGDVTWTVPANVRAVLNANPTTAPLFVNGAAGADLTTPSVTTLSVAYQFTDRFAMMADWSRTDWTSLREVNIDFANPDPNSIEEFDWKETNFSSIGAEYKLNEAWTLRGGYAYDETPTHIATRTPRLPDEDRQWLSVGASWQATPNLELNFAYTYLKADTPQVNLADAQGHRLVGEYDASINLYGVSAQYKF